MTTIAIRAGIALLYAFVLAPILLVFAISFSGDNFIAFPPKSWGFRWYQALLAHEGFARGFRNSVIISSIVVGLDLVIGVPAAYAIARLRFRGRDALLAFLTAPLLLPTIVLGLAILLVFFPLRLAATYTGLVIAHMVVTLPFVVRIVATALSTLPGDVEDAAATLGASPATVFRRITLPLMLPGMIAAAALAFIISFDEVVISLFVVGPRLSTLPVELFRYVEGRTDPLVAALSTALILATISAVLIVERSVGLMRALGR
ncbi:MAG: ABC transporter permease [Alphaproteobacteria bacterium]|nr:ABC transporter permease [Alphaproteobacteria bacterium]